MSRTLRNSITIDNLTPKFETSFIQSSLKHWNILDTRPSLDEDRHLGPVLDY